MLKNKYFWCAVSAMAMLAAGCGDDDKSDGRDLCANVICPTGTTCNVETGKCEADAADKCANVTCVGGKVCDPATGKCTNSIVDKCAGVVCDGNQACDPLTGKCTDTLVDKCANVVCTGSQVCNPATGLCVSGTDVCNGMKCPDGTVLNAVTCQCDAVVSEGCFSDADCKSDPNQYTYPEYCNPETHECENGLCRGKTWDREYQFCAVSGNVSCYEGFCGGKEGDLNCACAEGSVCDANTHRCVGGCDDIDGNIVPDWSFEDWTGTNSLSQWELVDNMYSGAASIARAKEVISCKNAVEFSNDSKKVARLESLPIQVDPAAFTGGNRKYDCEVHVMGTGKVNLGYRGLDLEGKKIGSATIEDKKVVSLWGAKESEKVEFEMSLPSDVRSVQMLIGLRKDLDEDPAASVTVDSLICTPQPNICDGVSCESWETCSVSSNIRDENGKYIGRCVPNDGFCSIRTEKDEETQEEKEVSVGCVPTYSECDKTTHVCRGIPGKCAHHSDCGAGQRCNDMHECETGDRCEGVKCARWMACVPETGKCAIPEGSCLVSLDCTTKDKPMCDMTTNRCVSIDATVDGTPGGKPINVVPNGSFELWEKVAFGVSETEYDLPAGWFGTEYEVYPMHLVTEFDPNNVREYTTSAHSGSKAVQLVNEKIKGAKRFSSEGFDVPAGSYDCSFYVRGKGDVRIHSFSSAGEQSKTEFTQIDTEDWQRIPFRIKNGRDMRLVFYVGGTDAAKDHIQIDDVICAPWSW